MTLPPQEAIPIWARGYPVEQQWSVYYKGLEQSGRLPAGASMHSDQLATQHASAWQTQYSGERAENAKLREKLEAMEKERREAEARWQKEISDAKIAAEKTKLDGEIAALRSELAMMRDGGSRRSPDWVSLVAAFAPLAVPFVAYLSERSKSAAMLNIEMRKLEAKQHENMLMLTKPQEQKSNLTELVAVLAPLVGPVILKMMDNSSPTMQAELLEMRNNSTLMQIKMLADIADRYDGEEPKPAWFSAVEAILGTLKQFGAQYQFAQMNKAAQPRPPLPAGTNGANGHVQPQPTVAGPDVPEMQVWQSMAEIDAEAANITKDIWDQMPREAGFHTNEWRLILFNVHAKTEYDELVPEIVHYLTHLARFNILPPMLTDVFATPEKFAVVINGLPISQMDPEYANGLIESLVGTIKAQRQTGVAVTPAPSSVVEAAPGPGDEDDGDEEYEDEGDDGPDDSDDGETAHA